MDYGEIFIMVTQRVKAFILWREFTARLRLSSFETEEDYLDNAYRFLNTSASRAFIKYCADYEKMDFDEYCKDLGIDQTKLHD